MKQIAFIPRNHLFTNTNTRMLNSQWLVFDVRSSGASFTGETIERVDIHTGEVEVIYRASQGAYVGVVTVHPESEKYVFIRDSENPDETQYYDFHHRRGVIVESGKVSDLDAMDTTVPYTPGALCGGSHVYVFSSNGERVSFTYSDYAMYELNPALDLRDVGAAAPFSPANVQKQCPREYSGSHWCVLVNKTTPTPQPGSDEINRAYEEGWVGNYTLAPIGDTLSPKGEKVPELFIAGLSKDEAGQKAIGDVSLSGAETTLPALSRDAVQRRLTLTHHRICPGLVNVPRHWVRCNPQGI